MGNRHSKELGACCFFMILLAFFSIVYAPIFEIYDELSIYILMPLLLYCLIRTSISRFDVVMVVCTVVYLTVSIVINDGGVGSILTYFCGMAFLIIISRARFSDKQLKALRIVCGVLTVFLALLSLLYIDRYWQMYEDDRYLNPNTYSIFLLYAYMLFICISPKKKFSPLNLLMTVLAVVGTFNYRSRAMVVAIIVFCLMQLAFTPKKFSGKILLLSVILVVIGLIIPFVYLLLYHNDVDLMIMGKSLFTGREKLWANMLKAFGNDPIKWLFGLGSKVTLSKHSLNIHNNLFVVIVNFGFVGLGLFLSMLFRYIKQACRNLQNRVAYKWYSMFVASILVLGMSETMSFWAPSMVFAYLGLGMAANNIHKDLRDEV